MERRLEVVKRHANSAVGGASGGARDRPRSVAGTRPRTGTAV